MSHPDFFNQDHSKTAKITRLLQKQEALLAEKYDRWEVLES